MGQGGLVVTEVTAAKVALDQTRQLVRVRLCKLQVVPGLLVAREQGLPEALVRLGM